MREQTNIIRDALNSGVKSAAQFNAAIKAQGESALNQLLIALQDNDAIVRTYALIYIGELGDIRAVESIVSFVHDKSRYRRDRLRRTFELLIPGIRSLRKRVETEERRSDLVGAARALGRINSSDSVETLRFLRNDSDNMVAAHAIKSLTRLGIVTE